MLRTIKKHGLEFTVNSSTPSIAARFWQSLQAFASTFRNFSFWNRIARDAYEPHAFAILDRFLDPEHSFIDIGSWIGPMVLYGCQKAKRCYSVEPDPVAFAILKSNMALNPPLQERITLHHGAIWSESGVMKFGTGSTFGDSMSSGLFTDSFMTIQVPSLTIEAFIERYQITDLNFIKMDIEAGETKVLPAMKDFLRRTRPSMFISLHPLWFPDLAEDTRRILDALSCYRYFYSKKGELLSADWITRKLKTRLILDIVVSEETWKV